MKKITCALALSLIGTTSFAEDGFSFYGGISMSFASGDNDLYAFSREMEGKPIGYFIGVDYDRNQYFVGLEVNVLQPHCDFFNNYNGPCGDDNLQGIHEPGLDNYSFVDLMDIKVRLGTNLGTDSTKIYGITGISIGFWDDDEVYYDASAALFGLGAEYEIYQGLAIGGEIIKRTSTSGSEFEFELSTAQLRVLYRF